MLGARERTNKRTTVDIRIVGFVHHEKSNDDGTGRSKELDMNRPK